MEKTLYDDAGIFVSTERFTQQGKTYQMTDVVSVKQASASRGKNASAGLAAVLSFVGVCGAIYQGGGLLLALSMALMVAACLWFSSTLPYVTLTVTMASGEIVAIVSPEEGLIRAVHEAFAASSPNRSMADGGSLA